ncbi:LysR family transcriptional regulator [Lawsonibacter sp. LCP25S3_G6]|uniref:LysR family transcriptional regulator n=1 Tax=unclassified Lawsonibacter TaxID=2617946 RepID=UPI003F96670A
MTLQQLEFSIAVAEQRHFTNAANELYVSQSTLSKQIIALEKELGIQLFVRNHRNVYLTCAGEEILEYIRRIVDEYVELQRQLSDSKCVSVDQIQFGAVPILNHYGITEQLIQFCKDNPDISLKISETVTADIFDMLDCKKIDIGLIRTAYLKDNCYDVLPLLKDEQMVLVSEDHPLSDRRVVDLTQLAEDRFMLMDTDPYYTRFYRKLLRDAGIQPKIEYTGMRVETIKRCVKNNTCVSLMMGKVADYPHMPGTVSLRIKGYPSLYLALVVKKDRMLSLGGEKLKSYLLQTVGGQQQK